MNMYRIITDSCCDLTQELADELDLSVVHHCTIEFHLLYHLLYPHQIYPILL